MGKYSRERLKVFAESFGIKVFISKDMVQFYSKDKYGEYPDGEKSFKKFLENCKGWSLKTESSCGSDLNYVKTIYYNLDYDEEINGMYINKRLLGSMVRTDVYSKFIILDTINGDVLVNIDLSHVEKILEVRAEEMELADIIWMYIVSIGEQMGIPDNYRKLTLFNERS